MHFMSMTVCTSLFSWTAGECIIRIGTSSSSHELHVHDCLHFFGILDVCIFNFAPWTQYSWTIKLVPKKCWNLCGKMFASTKGTAIAARYIYITIICNVENTEHEKRVTVWTFLVDLRPPQFCIFLRKGHIFLNRGPMLMSKNTGACNAVVTV